MENINVTNVALPSARRSSSTEPVQKPFTQTFSPNSIPSATSSAVLSKRYYDDVDENEILLNQNDGIVLYDLGDVYPDTHGSILELSLTLKKVIGGRRIAVGILLYELGANNEEYPRGFKTLEVPGQERQTQEDVEIRSIQFILPETAESARGHRRFVAKVISHYVDVDTNYSGI